MSKQKKSQKHSNGKQTAAEARTCLEGAFNAYTEARGALDSIRNNAIALLSHAEECRDDTAGRISSATSAEFLEYLAKEILLKSHDMSAELSSLNDMARRAPLEKLVQS